MTREKMENVVKDMIEAQSCYFGLREAGEAWLKAEDTALEEAAWKKLVAEAKADIMPIDELISSSIGIRNRCKGAGQGRRGNDFQACSGH